MEQKFEDKIKELESIIDELENGEIDLEESIEKYTKAIRRLFKYLSLCSGPGPGLFKYPL